MKRTVTIAVLTLAVPLALVARDAPEWELSLGTSYRTFDDVTFEETVLQGAGGGFVAGSHEDSENFRIEGDAADGEGGENVSPQLDPRGWRRPEGGDTYVREVYFDQAVAGGDDQDPEEAWGAVLGASRRFSRDSCFALDLGVAYFGTEVDTGSGRIETTTYTGFLTAGDDPGDNRPRTPYEEVDGTVVTDGGLNLDMTEELFDLGGPGTTAVSAEVDAEADLYVLSFGVSVHQAMDRIGVFAGAGPTLTVVDAESERKQSAVWDAPTNPLDGQPVPGFARRHSDSQLALRAGAYGSVGARVDVTERMAVSVSYRYDKVFGDVDLDHVSFDLDGHSGEVRLIFAY